MTRKEGYYQGTTVITEPGWGDAGKGKMTDDGAQSADMVIRYNGGPNAGHTVENNYGEFKLHGVSSGIFNPEAICVTATGVVVNPLSFAQEIQEIRKKDVSITPENFLISEDAALIMPWHRRRDGLKEKARGGQSIGTTGQGIGPAYEDHTSREGLRMRDLLADDFEEKFKQELGWQERLVRVMDGETLASEMTLDWWDKDAKDPNTLIREAKAKVYFNPETIMEELMEARETLAPFVTNVLGRIWEAEDADMNILGEGAQGALLDLDLGGYPFVTSSNPGAPGFSKATGIHRLDKVIGVTKAYTTRVGSGPMPTELNDEVGEKIREVGREYGATTGRNRRTGWFDAPAMRYGARTAGIDRLALTKLDIFDSFDQIGVCVGYKVDGKFYKNISTADPNFMYKAQPVIDMMPGWQTDTSNVHSYEDLPTNARKYVKRIEEEMRLPIDIVSVGPNRRQTVYR